MDVKIQTVEEFRSKRVSLVLTGEPEEINRAVDRLSDSVRRPLYQAAVDAERELVAAQARIVELEQALVLAGEPEGWTADYVRKDELDAAQVRIAELEHALKDQQESMFQRIHGRDGYAARLQGAAEHRDRADKLARTVKRLEDKVALAEAQTQDARREAVQMANERDKATALVVETRSKMAAQRAEDTKQIAEYDRVRMAERDRADGNRAWAERVEAKLALVSERYERVNRRLIKAQEIVNGHDVTHHLNLADDNGTVCSLADTIRKVRSALLVLDQPAE